MGDDVNRELIFLRKIAGNIVQEGVITGVI